MVTRRSAIKPEALKSILPMVALFDWTPPDQLVYRLQGTMLADRSQHDLTGMNFIDYVGPETAAALRQAMPGIVSQPCACQCEFGQNDALARKSAYSSSCCRSRMPMEISLLSLIARSFSPLKASWSGERKEDLT